MRPRTPAHVASGPGGRRLRASRLGGAGAQAWLPPQGEGWISFGYGNAFATKHYFGVIDPGEIDGGHMRGQSVGLQLGYGVTDHFTLSVGIPFVINKYYCAPEPNHESTAPHIPGPVDPDTIAIDDGQYHGTFQDFRVNLDYQLVSRRGLRRAVRDGRNPEPLLRLLRPLGARQGPAPVPARLQRGLQPGPGSAGQLLPGDV